jgi:hypothetical protein
MSNSEALPVPGPTSSSNSNAFTDTRLQMKNQRWGGKEVPLMGKEHTAYRDTYVHTYR